MKNLAIAAFALASAFTGSPLMANTEVYNALNSADMFWRMGADGCVSVQMAIAKANSPEMVGPTSAAVRADVTEYAKKCGLRF